MNHKITDKTALSLDQVREALGNEAAALSDAQLMEIRDHAKELADSIIPIARAGVSLSEGLKEFGIHRKD